MSKRDHVNKEYFDWMYGLVCNKYYSRLSYRKLLRFLHSIEFTYTIPRDKNRAMDGIDFRYRFGYENGYSTEAISEYLDTDSRPCSILEMMIALASRIENQFMDDLDFGNRTGQWFWNMIVNLGLGNMCDSRFDERYSLKVIERFLNREYAPNGEGSLFTLREPLDDMRETEIWYQAMWYLNEFLEE